MNGTTFEDKCFILAELWMTRRNDPQFEDYIQYNDLGLPLAYAIAEQIVESAPLAIGFIEEAFNLLLSALELEDMGYTTLDELLS
jgi:hypothetical protein